MARRSYATLRLAAAGTGGRPTGRARQRGSMSIPMMLMLVGLIGMLGLVEVGYLYWAKRDTQKVADLAALSGAQHLPDCLSSIQSASNNATLDNHFGGTLSIDACGTWAPVANANADHFVSPSAGGTPANAVKIVAQRPVLPIFGNSLPIGSVSATAVAIHSPPVAAFSVGSRLASISPTSALNQLLGSALDSSLGLQLLSYNGIANADISLLGLVDQLGINAGTLSSVLGTQVSISQFLDAYVQALSQSADAATIDMNLVQSQVAAIEAQIGTTTIALGDILNVQAHTDDPNVALDTQVSALDILSGALLAADGKNALALRALAVNLPGVANADLSLTVIEPPQIGVGPVGTTAHTAQVRLSLAVTALSGTALTGNQSLLDIPLYLEVAPATATLTAIQCGAQDNGSTRNDVTISATPGLVNAYVGKLPSDAMNNTQQSWPALIAGGQAVPVVNVNLLGIPVATLNLQSSVSLSAASTPPPSHVFSVDPTLPIGQQAGMTWSTADSPAIGLGNVISSLLGSTNLQTSDTLLGTPLGIDLGALLNGLTSLLSPVLVPLFDTLDTQLVSPLLQPLGIELGSADVRLMSVRCDAGAQLVY